MATNRQSVEAAASRLLREIEGLEATAASFDERAMDAQKLASGARTTLERLRILTVPADGAIRQQANSEEQVWRGEETEARNSKITPALARSRTFRMEHSVRVVMESDEEKSERQEAENALTLASSAAAGVSGEVAGLKERQQVVIRSIEEVCEDVGDWAGRIAELGGGG